MCNGLPRVGQHLIPVVPAKALGIDPHSTDSYDLVVADSEGETKVLAFIGHSKCPPNPRKGGILGVGLCLVDLTQNHEL